MVLGTLVLVAVSGVATWWYSASPDASSGTPRLVVDRTDVNLGYLRYKSPARVTFTLTNAGDAPLVLTEVPHVIVKAGC
jgi:hypothetical protein